MALGAACASKPADTGASPVVLRPLERMAGQEILVLPVQYLSSTDSLGWQQQIPNRAAFLAALDDQIEAAMDARGLGRAWTFAREVESDPMKTLSPALTENVATHFADLVLAP